MLRRRAAAQAPRPGNLRPRLSLPSSAFLLCARARSSFPSFLGRLVKVAARGSLFPVFGCEARVITAWFSALTVLNFCRSCGMLLSNRKRGIAYMKDLRTGDVNVPVPERALRQLDEPPVVDDAVYDGGHLVVAEHRSPPAELQVRGDHHRLPLVGRSAKIWKRSLAPSRIERQDVFRQEDLSKKSIGN